MGDLGEWVAVLDALASQKLVQNLAALPDEAAYLQRAALTFDSPGAQLRSLLARRQLQLGAMNDGEGA
jgi:hypothetical protein